MVRHARGMLGPCRLPKYLRVGGDRYEDPSSEKTIEARLPSKRSPLTFGAKTYLSVCTLAPTPGADCAVRKSDPARPLQTMALVLSPGGNQTRQSQWESAVMPGMLLDVTVMFARSDSRKRSTSFWSGMPRVSTSDAGCSALWRKALPSGVIRAWLSAPARCVLGCGRSGDRYLSEGD